MVLKLSDAKHIIADNFDSPLELMYAGRAQWPAVANWSQQKVHQG